MKSLLVTGGAGFIGSNFVHYCLQHRPNLRLVVLDKLTYAGNPENLEPIRDRIRFQRGDILDRKLVGQLVTEEEVDSVINFAAESHVDRSILGPSVFVETNVNGTLALLEAVREHGVERFVQVSTDEVYGSLGPAGAFTESSPLEPNSPYAASKAAADLLVRAYHKTYGLPAIITRSSNNYGPRQFPEKLIPLMIVHAFADKKLPVYGDGGQVRDWIHVEDHCSALLAVLERGNPGEVYNVGAANEATNLSIVQRILRHLGKSESLIEHVPDRPGHDRRCAIDAGKLRTELGWKPQRSFEEGLEGTIQWYLSHRTWWERLLDQDFRTYYRERYRAEY